ncbi:hypothetical protein EDD86DRAFT_199282 [Gorgonomyces haynaldii]|nr:hypothetical protein EDD86DRAFT_199282 [Gorgonomyces haynaldii]
MSRFVASFVSGSFVATLGYYLFQLQIKSNAEEHTNTLKQSVLTKQQTPWTPILKKSDSEPGWVHHWNRNVGALKEYLGRF